MGQVTENAAALLIPPLGVDMLLFPGLSLQEPLLSDRMAPPIEPNLRKTRMMS